MHHSRWILLRILAAHPRLFASSLLGTVVALLCALFFRSAEVPPLLVGWNAGALLYILLVSRLMLSGEQASIRQRARMKSEGQFAVFSFSILSGLAGLFSTVSGLSTVREIHGVTRGTHIALTALAIGTSWFFTHLMFAQEYAHRLYRNLEHGQEGGLIFPGNEIPDYLDFFYVAMVIGTSGHTADVAFSSSTMRRIASTHCVLAFVFNTTVLALTVNIAASLF